MALAQTTPATSLSLAADSQSVRTVQIDTDTAVTLYYESNNLRARVIDISGGSVSEGAEQDVWASVGNNDYGVDVASSTQIVVGISVSNAMRLRTMTISGNTITENATDLVESVTPSAIHVVMCTSTLGLVGYTAGDAEQTARLARFTISGTTITSAAPINLDGLADNHDVIGMCALDSSRVFVLYRDDNISDNAMIMVVDISSGVSKGTAVQLDTDADVTTSGTGHFSCTKVDTDKVAVGWVDTSESAPTPKAIIVNTSGTTISSQGSAYTIVIGNANALVHSIEAVSTSSLVVCYTTQASTNAKIETLNVNGNVITTNSDTVTTDSDVDGPSSANVTMLSTTEALFGMIDGANDCEVSIITGFDASYCPTGQFYFGFASLDYKFNLPFGVDPHGFTLDESLGTVVMGANCADRSDKVAYTQFPYESYTLSDDGIPSAAAIKALRWI